MLSLKSVCVVRSFVLLAVLMSVASCGPKLKAQRMSTSAGDEKAMSITDNWMVTDTTNAVQEVLKQMNKNRSYRNYLSKFGDKTPKVFIAELQNNTAEAYFPIQDLNDELLNELSATGDFILIDENARQRILKEIKYQNDGMVDTNDAKKIGKQAGADLLIFGNVNMKPEMLGGKTLKEYSVNIRMTDIQSGVEVMRARYKISKYSERSGYGW